MDEVVPGAVPKFIHPRGTLHISPGDIACGRGSVAEVRQTGAHVLCVQIPCLSQPWLPERDEMPLHLMRQVVCSR